MTASTRLAILQAEERGATSARDLLIIKNALGPATSEIVRMAVRALGRLERPSQIPDDPDVAPPLAARSTRRGRQRRRAGGSGVQNAEARRGWSPSSPRRPRSSRGWNVRPTRTSGPRCARRSRRLPYQQRSRRRAGGRRDRQPRHHAATSTADRLGVAKGLEALLRIQRSVRPAGDQAIQLLKNLIRQAATRSRIGVAARRARTPARARGADERQRAGQRDRRHRGGRCGSAGQAARDAGGGDQRRGNGARARRIARSCRSRAPRSLRALRSRADERTCDAAISASHDSDLEVALVAMDQLGACGQSPAAVALLERTVADRSELAAPRGWHRNVHALVALAAAAPDRAAGTLEPYIASSIWQVRMYAARAAGATERPDAAAAPGRRSRRSRRQRRARGAGRTPRPPPPHEPPIPPATADDLRRLAAPRAVITIRGVGRFELALFTAEAPATVLRFVQLAESGYYNGLTFDRLAPNAIVQGRQARRGRGAAIRIWKSAHGLT